MKLIKHKLLIVLLFATMFVAQSVGSTAYAHCGTASNTCATFAQTTINQPLSKSQIDNDCKADGGYKSLNKDNCQIIKIITLFTKALSGIAGLVIIAMIILGGIQYSAAGADPSKVQAAKQKIFNALLALLLLVFGFAILQWLVPGGIF
jgi:hypothetical protein